MIRKLMIYFKSDGLQDCLKYCIKTIVSMFYRKSITDFYFMDLNDGISYKMPEDFHVSKFVSFKEINNICFPRLTLLDCHKWFNRGSVLYIGYYKNVPVSYTWTHFKNYELHVLGDFLLSHDECWIGPTFVHKKYRGKGFNKAQIRYQINDMSGYKFFTSTSHNNIASSKSFLNLGFMDIGSIELRKNIFTKKRYDIDGDTLEDKIQLK